MLSDELARLTRDFHKRPGASEAAVAEFARSVAPIPLPADYPEFVAASNGAYGQPGGQGLWVRLDPIEDVLAVTRGHAAPTGLLLIGGTRLGDGLAIDARLDLVRDVLAITRGRGAQPGDALAAAARPSPARVVTVDLGRWGEFDALDVLGESLEAALRALETMGPAATAERPGQGLEIVFVPTPQPAVAAMLTAARLRPGEVVYDLGCGDGRIVITAAREFSARGVGFDLNLDLIHVARAAAVAANVRHMATFRRDDLYAVDVSPADVVALYLRSETNARLLPQLRQLKPGARVVTYEFRIPGVEPARTEVVEYAPGAQGHIFVWEAPLLGGSD